MQIHRYRSFLPRIELPHSGQLSPMLLMHGSAIQVYMLLFTGIAREMGTAMENAETL